jgi:multidrug efflux pump subunit AcrA (membrane-fusion protein)
MKRSTRRFAAAGAVLLAGTAGLVWWWGGPGWSGLVASASPESMRAVPAPDALDRVAALGRLEPRNGVVRVAGPPRPAVVIEELLVEEGDRVGRGLVLATLAGIAVERADVARLRAELVNAGRELERNQGLRRQGVLAEARWEELVLARDVARAALSRAEAELELSTVRAPLAGQVLEVHARPGERVEVAGVVELGDTASMYAVAEVYETDIGRVRLGQPARVRSPALPRELAGEVERIGLKIGKKDVLSTDPVADADARVVEVEVRLHEPEHAAALTNLRVEVLIGP